MRNHGHLIEAKYCSPSCQTLKFALKEGSSCSFRQTGKQPISHQNVDLNADWYPPTASDSDTPVSLWAGLIIEHVISLQSHFSD